MNDDSDPQSGQPGEVAQLVEITLLGKRIHCGCTPEQCEAWDHHGKRLYYESGALARDNFRCPNPSAVEDLGVIAHTDLSKQPSQG